MLQDNIKNLRKAKGWSQEELALKLNVVRQTISKWEKGLSVPDSEMLIRIADELETPVTVLLGESEEPEEVSGENEVSAGLKEIAARLEILNEQLARRSERQRKIWSTVFIILGIAAVFILLRGFAGVIYFLAATDSIRENVSAIGGYDGPTDIYVSNVSFHETVLIAALAAVVISVAGIFKTRRK